MRFPRARSEISRRSAQMDRRMILDLSRPGKQRGSGFRAPVPQKRPFRSTMRGLRLLQAGGGNRSGEAGPITGRRPKAGSGRPRLPFNRATASASHLAAGAIPTLLAEAAFQAPAHTGRAPRRERELLLLGQLHGDGGKSSEEALAAARPAAGAAGSRPLREVVRPEALQSVPHARIATEVPAQLPEIHLGIRREEDGRSPPAGIDIRIHESHGQRPPREASGTQGLHLDPTRLLTG